MADDNITKDGDVVVTTAAEIEKTPEGKVKRWLAELAIADKDEKEWREQSKTLWEKYEAKNPNANSFNILWSNTETICPAVYNSTPQPDVRRRFRDEDPTGKVASTVLERTLSYEIDSYDFDDVIKDVVLDAVLLGRGVPRIRYEPKFVAVGPDGQATPAPVAGAYIPPADAAAAGGIAAAPSQSPEGVAPATAAPASFEKLADQRTECEHVQWDKFRRGPGKRWVDVPWIAYEHEFTREMCEEKFGPEIAAALEYEEASGSKESVEDSEVRKIFKVVKVHEIWDKETRRVLFIAPCYKTAPCLAVPDPLRLEGFYPQPRPLYAIRNSRTLVPKPLYRLYEEQAKELDNVSARINKIVTALRVRGAYSANLPELAGLIEADDNSMTPVANVSEIASLGGLDKAIWMMPTRELAQALKELYLARDQIKQTIYEIMGIGDILRGQSDANETLGAQKIKTQWGSLRLQKLQQEIQRMIRDLMRLTAEVIAQQYAPETLAACTNVQLPSPEDKAAAQGAIQEAALTGAPPPPEATQVLQQPTWADVMALLESDGLRQCRIDIETDSTIAETINRDMQGITEVLQALAGWVQQGFAAVQAGVMGVDTLKEVSLAIVRRARLGSAVEDAFENIQAPAQAQQPGGTPTEQELQQLGVTKDQVVKLLQGEADKRRGADDAMTQVGQRLDQHEQMMGAVGKTIQQLAITQTGHKAVAERESTGTQVVLARIAQALASVAHSNHEDRVLMQQTLAAVAGTLGAVATSTKQTNDTLAAVLQAINTPKKIDLTRGADGRVAGATATPEITH